MSQQNVDDRNEPVKSPGPTGIYGIDTDLRWSDLWLLVPAGMVAIWTGGLSTNLIHPLAGLVVAPAVMVVTALYMVAVRDRMDPPHKHLWKTITFWRSDKEVGRTDETEGPEPGDLTGVEQVHPGRGAVEREDGTYVASAAVGGSAMAVETPSNWQTTIDEYREHLAGVEFPTTVSVRGQPVSPEIMTAGLQDRLKDGDVEGVDALEEIIKVHIERWPAEFRRRGTCLRQYRVTAPVDVTEAKLGDRDGLDRLGQIPIAGELIRDIGASAVSRDEDEIREAQAELLSERVEELVTTFDGMGDGCTARGLSAMEHGEEIEAFWNNRMTDDLEDALEEESRFQAGPPVREGGLFDVGEMPTTGDDADDDVSDETDETDEPAEVADE